MVWKNKQTFEKYLENHKNRMLTNPELKEKERLYHREYHRRPYVKEKISRYMKEYNARPYVKEKRDRAYLELKNKVLSHYSNGKLVCACCGDNRFCFLSIDHIVAASLTTPAHIKKNARKLFETTILFKKLVLDNFPIGFQVLCMNCNKLKNTKEKCPCKELQPSRVPTWNW